MQNSPFWSHGGKQFFYANGQIPREGHHWMHAYKAPNDEWRRAILGPPHVWHQWKWSTKCQKWPDHVRVGQWRDTAESQPQPLVVQLDEGVMRKDLRGDLNWRIYFFIPLISPFETQVIIPHSGVTWTLSDGNWVVNITGNWTQTI